ncbi:MAG TPA: hypothetical protein VEN29_08975 [Casimicrobiaceae bacterium]|nr:hypothetical protein [Casimicrobiaceae bacterium]
MFILLLSTMPLGEVERRPGFAVRQTARPKIRVRMRRLVISALSRLFRALGADQPR